MELKDDSVLQDLWDAGTQADTLINFVTVQKTVRIVLILFLVASLVLVARLGWRAYSLQEGSIEGTVAALDGEVGHAATNLDEMLGGVEPVLAELAAKAGEVSRYRMYRHLQTALEEQPNLTGLGLAYAANAVPDGSRYAPYVYRSGRRIRRAPLTEDYTAIEPRNQWYYDTLLDGKTWYQPLYHPPTKKLVVGLALRFSRRGAAEPAGVVYATIALESLAQIMGPMKLGTYGYPFLFTEQGTYLLDPQIEIADDKPLPTIFERAWTSGQQPMAIMAIRAIQRQSGRVHVADPANREDAWIFYQSIPTSGWALAAKSLKSDFQASNDELRHSYIFAALACLLVFGFSGALITIQTITTNVSTRRFLSWWFGAMASVLLSVAIGTVWYLSNRYPETHSAEGLGEGESTVKITSRDVMGHYLERFTWESLETLGEKPTLIPTGVFVQSVEFLSSVNVKVTGYIWQKYAQDVSRDIAREILLPEAESVSMTETYRLQQDDHELIGWYYEATLRQSFDYTKYPHDRQDVWLRLWPKDFSKNIILVPDFESYYPDINPHSLPGVEKALVLPGLNVEQSYFSYRQNSYSTDFGIKDYAGLTSNPELYFNVAFHRDFLEPFISRVISVLVCAVILYTLVITFSKEGDTDLFGFSVTTVALGCAALFFVIILDHISLRQAFASASVIYFEYFYFSLYFMIVLVLIYSVLYAVMDEIPFLGLSNHFLPKLSFWPLFLTIILAQTLVVFY